MSLYKVTAFTLKHNGPVRNLCLITSGSLRYEERVVHSPTAKFGYEESQHGFGRGVHLRCLHNNKYLVRGASTDWITATGNEPVEDTSRRDWDDRHRKETWFETFPVSNGDVRLRSVRNGRFMRRDNNGWILANSNDNTSNDPNTVFQIARLSDSTIALINRGNNRFCQRIAIGTNDGFKAEIDSGVKEAELAVEEPIVDRTVDVEYRFRDARIYEEKPRSWLSQVAFNDAKDRDLETQLAITYTESHTFSFHVTTTIKTNFLMRTSASAGVPLVAKATTEFEFSAGFDLEAGFEKTHEKSESYEFRCNVVIPPGQKRRAKVMALEAKCDVPFNYVQTEVVANGEVIRTNLEDGVYRGMNGYEFHVQVYDPDEPSTVLHDEPVATRYLPDTFAREKVYLKNN